MGTYVKGMETPTWCGECDFLSGLIIPDNEYHCCAPTNNTNYSLNVTDNVENWSRPDWCPLVEVPEPHGRLIDAEKLKNEYPHDTDWDYPVNTNSYVCESIDNAPTVIEAEGE